MALVHSDDEQTIKSRSSLASEEAAAFTEWHKPLRRCCDGLDEIRRFSRAPQLSTMRPRPCIPDFGGCSEDCLLLRVGRRQTRGSLWLGSLSSNSRAFRSSG